MSDHEAIVELEDVLEDIQGYFEVRGWKPNKVEKINVYNRNHTIYVYTMPPVKQ